MGTLEREALGVVLAGGRGRRLGGSKAGVELAGRPLISYPLAAFEAAGIEAVVCAKPGQELPAVAAPLLREAPGPRHPLCGIVAALREGRPVVAVGCDMPFVAPALMSLLAAESEPLVVPAPGGRVQPLLARYDPRLLPDLEEALEREAPLTATVESLGPRTIDAQELSNFGDPDRLLLNVNAPADLRRAEEMLAGA
jgi:molybdenum cofactor guanylyltransferase